MKKVLAAVLATVGAIAATLGTSACLLLCFDEPEMYEE